MRFLCLPLCAALLALTGCITPTARGTLNENERITKYVITHHLSKRQAYDAAEIQMAKIFVSSKTVIDVKQPDNGRIIAKAVTAPIVTRSGLLGETLGCICINYALDIQTADNTANLTVEITGKSGSDGGPAHDGYPNDMSKLRQDFDNIADSLAKAVGGTITERPAPLPQPSRSPTTSVDQ